MISTKGNTKVLLSWSYSVYTQWLKCPFSVFLDKIARVKMAEPPNPNFEKGGNVHALAQAHVEIVKPTTAAVVKAAVTLLEREGNKASTKVLNAEYKKLLDNDKVSAKLTELHRDKASAEGELAFDRNWRKVDWRDWTRAWLRVKCDVVRTVLKPKPLVNIVDWKTGKVYDDHKQQRSLYALAGLQLVKLGELAGGDPKTEVVAEHIYTDTGLSATETFLPKQLEPLKKEWGRRIEFMMKDTKFPMKEGHACRWCKHRKSAGGSCPANQ